MAVDGLLDNRGNMVTGPMSFYHLPGGLVLFSEDIKHDGKNLVFDLTKSCVVGIQQDKNGVVQFSATRADELPVFMEASRYSIDSTHVGTFNSTNPELYATCRSSISKLQLYKGR